MSLARKKRLSPEKKAVCSGAYTATYEYFYPSSTYGTIMQQA
jgi:hypothetical protein